PLVSLHQQYSGEFHLSPQTSPTNRVRWLRSAAFPAAADYLRWREFQSLIFQLAHAPAENCGPLFQWDELTQLRFAKSFWPVFLRALVATTHLDLAGPIPHVRRLCCSRGRSPPLSAHVIPRGRHHRCRLQVAQARLPPQGWLHFV